MVPRKVKNGEWEIEVKDDIRLLGQVMEEGPALRIGPTEVKGTGDIQGLENLSDLRYFSLRGGSLETVDANIGKLLQLKHLIIESCDKLQSISGEIGKLSHLETLQISGYGKDYPNKLKQLPPEIGNLQSLRDLSLQYSALDELPKTLGNLANLTELRIEWCPLHALPVSMGNLQHLESFRLYQSNIKEIPACLCELKTLKRLDLDGNKSLSSLPSNLGNLANLEYLSFYDMQDLPESIGNLRNLRKLRCCFSKFSQLPDTFGNLESLSDLTLSNCKQLKSLPDSFCKLLNLKSLDLSFAGFESVPVQLHALKNLEELNLDYLPLDKEEMTLYDNIKKADKDARKEQIRPLLTYLGRKYDLIKGFHGDLPKIDALRKQIIEELDKALCQSEVYKCLENNFDAINHVLTQLKDKTVTAREFLGKLKEILAK